MEQIKNNEFAHSYLKNTEIHIFCKKILGTDVKYYFVVFPMFLKTGKLYGANTYLKINEDNTISKMQFQDFYQDFEDTRIFGGSLGTNKHKTDCFGMSCFGSNTTSVRLPKVIRENVKTFVQNFKALALECNDLQQLRQSVRVK